MIESGKSSVKKWKRTDGSGNRRNTGWKETVKWLTEAAADLVFPKRCVLCDEIIPFDRRKEGYVTDAGQRSDISENPSV